MKKIFKEEFLNKKKVLDFLDKKGFYIVLLLCVGIITTTAYTVTKRNLSSYMEGNDLSQLNPPVTKPDTSLTLPATSQESKPSVKPTENKASETQNKKTTSSKSQVKQTKPASKPTVAAIKVASFTKPVSGGILQDYAKTSLVYSKTLDEWTTHTGLDYSVDLGTTVKASLDGTIDDVYQDLMYGTTIMIDHGNGIKTKYANLSNDGTVKKGDKVKKGLAIGKVGNTAIAESSEQPHLHFEVLKNGISVNPKDFIKQ